MRRNLKKGLYPLFVAIFLLFLSHILFPIHSEAVQTQQTIRIGYYPMNNYHAKDSKGNMVGYEIDYLHKIAEITGWTYEFVEASSWVDAVSMLDNGQVDIISPAQITEERLSKYSFSAIPAGRDYGALFTLSANNDCYYEDYDVFSNMTFGVEIGVSFQSLFSKYAAENGFTPKRLKTYRNADELINALNTGDVDAIICNIMRMEDNMKLVGKFNTSSYYFMLRQESDELLSELNNAMHLIDSNYPTFQYDLTLRYFPGYTRENFTREEVEFAKTLPTLRVGCASDIDPISYVDSETGQIAGITRDLLELVGEYAGLSFEYVAIPSGDITYDDLRALDLDFTACVERNGSNINAPGISLSQPYFLSKKVVVGKQGVVYHNDSALTVAVNTGSQTLIGILEAEYPNFVVERYYSNTECMDAIVRGDADIMIQNQYVVQSLLAKPQYSELSVIPSRGISDDLCITPMVYKDAAGEPDPVLSDKRLLTLINKGISRITASQSSAILIANTTDRPYPFILGDFLYRYRVAFGLFVASVLFISIGLVYIMRLRRKNYLLLQKSENKLQNITNNINGGVVVLLPNEGMKITYANDGFLDLLHLGSQDYGAVISASYTMYVHPDDIIVINNLIQLGKDTPDQISIRIRIKRNDGIYIPARFNGTIATNESGEAEMFCVIMDISQEIEMLNKLDLEQRKHNLLIEKSNEIIYEVNLEKKLLHSSDAFAKTFGWNLESQYSDIESISSMWKIHEQDTPLFQDMLHDSMKLHEDSQCNIRMLTKEGPYRWFNISQYIMKDKYDNLLFILGKISDIDDIVKEKQLLEKKSQTDPMTGLYNKETFLKLSANYLEKSRDTLSALIFLDLDGFKNINDSLGHMIGDTAIQDTAKKLQIIFSGYDLLTRFGGDEFCVLVKEIPWETLEEKIKWTLGKLSQVYEDGTHSISISVSIGVARTIDCGFDISTLLHHADTALYVAKKQGKNQYVLYQDGVVVL